MHFRNSETLSAWNQVNYSFSNFPLKCFSQQLSRIPNLYLELSGSVTERQTTKEPRLEKELL